MFIEFSFGNFRSFRDVQKLTLEAAPSRSNDSGLEEGNVFSISTLRLLKSKAIYGGNASGKSNVAKAIGMFYTMVNRSVAEEGLPKKIWNDRFKLITNWDDEPIFFQYILLHKDRVFRYGFQILDGKVSREWLYSEHENDEVEYFMRNNNTLDVSPYYLADSTDFIQSAFKQNSELFRTDSLVLTAAALNGNSFLSGIRDKIRSMMMVNGSDDSVPFDYAIGSLLGDNEEQKTLVKKLLKAADTGIEDIELRKSETPSHLSDEYHKKFGDEAFDLFSLHSRYDENGNLKDKIYVRFSEWESEGTKKLLGIGSLLIDAIIQGRTIVMDEFDAKFHPNLTLKILELFHNEDTNPHGAQLIFVTHDTGLLRRGNLRRDQICFVDKDRYGLSSLTNLIEYKGVRKDASYDKEYLNGSYNAVPLLSDIDSIFYGKKES
jgi:AAA15 family ATPase/GTPase